MKNKSRSALLKHLKKLNKLLFKRKFNPESIENASKTEDDLINDVLSLHLENPKLNSYLMQLKYDLIKIANEDYQDNELLQLIKGILTRIDKCVREQLRTIIDREKELAVYRIKEDSFDKDIHDGYLTRAFAKKYGESDKTLFDFDNELKKMSKELDTLKKTAHLTKVKNDIKKLEKKIKEKEEQVKTYSQGLKNASLKKHATSYLSHFLLESKWRVLDVQSHIRKGRILFVDKPAKGVWIWVVDKDKNFIIANRRMIKDHPFGMKLPHSVLAKGGIVLGSGELLLKKGIIVKFNSLTGHYFVKNSDFNRNCEKIFRIIIKHLGIDHNPEFIGINTLK